MLNIIISITNRPISLLIYSYVGKHPTPRGGRDFENFQGGDYFLRIFWRGIDILPLKGGISLTNLDQKSKIFQIILFKGGISIGFGFKISKRGGIILV